MNKKHITLISICTDFGNHFPEKNQNIYTQILSSSMKTELVLQNVEAAAKKQPYGIHRIILTKKHIFLYKNLVFLIFGYESRS